MLRVLLFYLLIFNIHSSPPTQNQDADASYFAYKIYDGVDTLNTDYGCVIKSHQSAMNGAYAVWKHYRTKECYVIIRGTKLNEINTDLLTDMNVVEIYDEELGVYVHNGVRLRTEFILADIGDGLKECRRDIIITGHSLGGSITHYLFLKYVKRHYYDWGEQQKASKFKAVMFSAPQLTTRSNNQLLVNYENNINWYKYESEFGAELVRTIKNAGFLGAIALFFGGQIALSQAAFDIIQSIHYGDYIPGNKYYLWNGGGKEDYRYIFGKNWNIGEHTWAKFNYDAITVNGWGTESPAGEDWDKTNCLQMNYLGFLNEEKDIKSKSNPKDLIFKYDDGTIEIDTAHCENVDDYEIAVKYEDIILYTKNSSNTPSYILKRILDNEKEYEYAICSDTNFILKQCDENCKCHEITKNDRPKTINQCSSYQLDSTMKCMVDEKYKKVETKVYFSLVGQTKIDDYYLMDYFCNNQIYQRGNYNNANKIFHSFELILLIILLF